MTSSPSVSPAPAATTVLEVLGSARIYDVEGGGEVVREARLTSLRATLLIALLAAEPGSHDFASLILAVIDGGSDITRHDENLLQQAVAAARRALGPASDLLSTNRGHRTYELIRDPTRLRIDIDDADLAVRESDWAAVLAKHRGTFMQGLYDHILDDHRTRQRRQIASAIRHLRPDLGDGLIQSVTDQVLAGRAAADILPEQRQAVDADGRERLVLARDMQRSYELHGEQIQGTPAHISGLVLKQKKAGGFVFLDVMDGTGQVQVAVPEDTECWELGRELGAKESVRVHGHLAVFKPKHSAPVVTVVADQIDRVAATESRRAASSIYLARLANHFRAALSQAGYAEVETKLISSEWPSDGVEVLKILYDGMGPGAFALAPSPVPQLIQHLIELPVDRAFTVGRCITPTYRDPHVSSEAMVVSAVAADASIGDVLSFVHETAVELHRSGNTAPLTGVASRLARRDLTWPPYGSASGVETPELQLFEPVPLTELADPGAARQVARLCWPYFHEQPQFRDYVLAEGYSTLTRDEEDRPTPTLTVATINIERLLTLLLNEYEGRPIPALAS